MPHPLVERLQEALNFLGQTTVRRPGVAQDRRSEPDEPTAVLPGPGSRLPGAPLTETQTAGDQPGSAEVAAKLAGRTAADIFGYSEQRREIARRLNADPYTDNPVLARRLDEIAWAASVGCTSAAA